MKKLLKYLAEYKKESFLSPLFKMLEASFELLVPLVVASMIDIGIGNADKSRVLKCFFIMVILGLVGFLAACTAQYFAAKAATGFSRNLRHDLFKHILSLNFSEIDELGTSTMITRMTADVNTVQNGVNMFLRLFLRSPFIVAGAAFMAFTIDFKAALIFVVVIAVLFLAVGLIMKINIPQIKNVQKKLDRVLGLTRENLSGARVIRAFTQEDEQLELFTQTNNELTGLQLLAGRVSALTNPLTYVIINMAIAYLIISGGNQVYKGILTPGQVVALYNYMSQILLELIKFAGLIVTINKALASANRISDIFDIKSEKSGSVKDASEKDVAIEFKNVSLCYHEGSDEALSDISFALKKGQTMGIIGGTGAGKTSLINLIPGFYKATKGEVLVNGINVNEYDNETLRSQVGMVLQKAVLFKGTIAENLRWGNDDASDEELMDAIDMAVATDVVNAKGGLDAVIEQNGRNLSGGQRQRLTIARALVKKPKILILDDASSALDNVTDLKLRQNIKAIQEDNTVIIVSQRTASVQNADVILVLDDGQLVGMGTHGELLRTCEVYKEIYDSQFKKEAE